jgi:mannose-6-phosphate isomerase-like protein (cupin superfamily)
MNKGNNFYSNRVVYKPWGYEYVIYNDARKLAITLVCVNYGHKTSLHCHPKKKTAFIILEGRALVQIGIYRENSKYFTSQSRLVFRPGLFHSIKAVSKKNVYALEFEAPYDKNDLLRFKDNYGRQTKDYEGKKFTKKITETDFIKFKKPKLEKKYIYTFNNLEVLIETTKNLKHLSKKYNKSTSAILAGSIVDNRDQNAISFGEVVKTSTLRILAKKFKIKEPITIMHVTKRKNKINTKNKFI